MNKDFILRNIYGEIPFEEKFTNIFTALYHAKSNLDSKEFNDMFLLDETSLKKLDLLDKYVAIDWCSNILLDGKIFDDEDEAFESISEYELTESIQIKDLEIDFTFLLKNGKYYLKAKKD